MGYHTTYEDELVCEMDDGRVKGSVVLLGYLDMQTNFLKTLIEDELDMLCQVEAFDADHYPVLAQDTRLILIDCKHVAVDEIGMFIHAVSQNSTDQRVALLNLKNPGQEGADHYEKLVQWPHVKGIFYETVEQQNLIAGLNTLIGGGDWLPRNVMQRIIDEFRSAPRMRAQSINLTRRERQILRSLLEGATNLDIANALELSEYTIKSHLYNVFKKIGVKNRIQAYNWAQMNLSD